MLIWPMGSNQPNLLRRKYALPAASLNCARPFAQQGLICRAPLLHYLDCLGFGSNQPVRDHDGAAVLFILGACPSSARHVCAFACLIHCATLGWRPCFLRGRQTHRNACANHLRQRRGCMQHGACHKALLHTHAHTTVTLDM